MFRSLRHLSGIQKVALVIWLVILLGVALWLARRDKQQAELQRLLPNALLGEQSAIDRISAMNTQDADDVLRHVAATQASFGREAALNALGTKTPLDSKFVAQFMDLNVSANMRHAAADIFERRGCDEVCMSVTLNALQSLWRGDPTGEMKLDDPPVTAERVGSEKVAAELRAQHQQILAQIRSETENHYLAVLRKDSCHSLSALTSGTFDSKFSERLRAALPPCVPR